MSSHQLLPNDLLPSNRRQGLRKKPPSSRESTASFVNASEDVPDSTTQHGITSIKAPNNTSSPTSGIPESVNVRCPRVAGILHRIASRCRALLQSTLQSLWSTNPSQDKPISPVEVPEERRKRPPRKGFCVLSLDGGGCRGFISLLILKYILRRLQPEGPIYPYLYFDLICGTSTGGLIAILLGVLHLDIDTTLELYLALVGEVFADGFSTLRYLRKDAGYSRKPLKRAIARILEVNGRGRALMEDAACHRDCRSFVTTTHCVGGSRRVFAVRSYGSQGGMPSFPDGLHWTCRDAALATSAAPGIFRRHLVAKGRYRYSFEDAGAHRTNNPTEFAWEECQRLDTADPLLNAARNSLFISLGTGARGGTSETEERGWFGLFRIKMDTLRVSARYATDVNDVHESMKGKGKDFNMSYFRLNPPLGQRINLGDWEEIPAMEESVVRYCEQNKTEIQQCVIRLDSFQAAERRRPQNRSPVAPPSV